MKSLLSRWREKVFVLLVQQKLQQIQESREKMEARFKVTLAHFLSHSAVWSAFDLLTVLIKKTFSTLITTFRPCLYQVNNLCNKQINNTVGLVLIAGI